MIDGNDGGLNITHDRGKTWRFVENLPIGQFYHINVDMEFPYNVYGGMQDNGSWRGPAYVWKAQGIRNSYWQEISFGDGFDVVPDKENSRYGWSMSQQGYVSRYDYLTGNNYGVRPTHKDPNIKLRFNWNAAINIDPFDNATLYFGSQFVHKSTDKGLTWNVISPDLSTNNPVKLKQAESGGLTMDATGAENHCTILVIEPSVLEKNMLWTATDDGQVHITKNGGTTWTNVSKNIKGLPENSWITQIKASNKNKGEALLVANDYRRFNYTPYAYRTKNYGKTWQRIVDENDVQSYTLSIVEDPKNANLLFLGTDDGLYISIDAGNKWTKWTNGFPTVPVKDLVIHPREHDLIIGTFGRAAWVLDDIRPLRAIAKGNITSKKLVLFAPPTAYQAAYQQPTGSRFGADALYNGENRKRGAMISYVTRDLSPLQKDLSPFQKDKDKTKHDSIKLEIFDGNRLIRTLKQKTPKENGIHKLFWFMDEKGVARPSRTIRKQKREPSGVRVKPGVYHLKMTYGDATSEQNITVAFDPRLQISDEAINQKYEASKELETYQEKMATIVKQLVESKNTAKSIKSKLSKADAEVNSAQKKYKTAIKSSSKIIKKIDSVIAIYLGKVDKRQGITRNPEVSVYQRFRIASSYVRSRFGKQTDTEKQLVHQFKDAFKKAVSETNTFFNNDWTPYKESVEKIEVSPFKKVNIFSVE